MPDRIVRHNGIPEHSRWCNCNDCRAAWEDWHEAKYLDRLALRHIELRQAKPATEQEWAEFFDAELPRLEASR